MNGIYNSSFPGSILWDLTAKYTTQLVHSWSVSVRHMWDLPVNSHRSFIESLGGTHAQTMLMSRYINFIQSVGRSKRRAVLFLFQRCKDDLMTVTGRNIEFIQSQVPNSSILKMKSIEFKKQYKFCEMKTEDEWKLNFVKEIVDLKQNVLQIQDGPDQLTTEELDEILNFIVTN